MVATLAFCVALAGSLCGPHGPAGIATATRFAHAPAFGGSADDSLWRSVPATSDFTQWSPRDGGAPSVRTEFRIGYDARNLYVLVRAYDPRPDSIVGVVTRRDGTSASDEIGIYLDPNRDHRTGYEFYVNAAGVQRDAAINADSYEDLTWDGVWQAITRVDSLGWTAEFRIPFSQLQFAPSDHDSFGILVNRVIQRRGERVSWPAFHASRPGIVSQFGVLSGLDGISGTRGIEIAPFARAQSAGGPSSSLAAGADIRVRPSSNVAIDGTLFPDFGQVEADPAVVNLSSIETFYPERRPFFVDASGTFRMGFDCLAYLCDSDGLFYSRRIGRSPQLASLYGNAAPIAPATILGAAKLTSRATDGWRVGALAAQTARETAPGGSTIEPATTYAAARLERDSYDGRTVASLVGTLVDRSLDQWSAPYLGRTAAAVGGNFRHRFGNGQYEIWGSASGSQIVGSARAIAELQSNDVHVFQRPGYDRLDTSRTALVGDQEEIALGKYGGAWNYEVGYERQARGFDVNDLGFLQRADQQIQETWIQYTQRRPTTHYNSWWWSVTEYGIWNAGGMRMETAAHTSAHVILPNTTELAAGTTIAQLGSPMCDHCARGGPAMRVDPLWNPFVTVTGNARAAIVPAITVIGTFGDEGRSHSLTELPAVSVRVSPQLQASVGLVAIQNDDNTQWLGNFSDSAATHYAFAHIHQHTQSFTVRTSYAATTKLTLETYVAPFVSDARYGDVRELSAAPAAESYDQRYTPFAAPPGTALGFDVRQVRATMVMRWEYAPGSALFLVWTRDAANVLAAKLSYRLGA